MVDVFETNICNYCKNTNCEKNIIKEEVNNIISFKCLDYQKDESKICPYTPPLLVTAKRDYIPYMER